MLISRSMAQNNKESGDYSVLVIPYTPKYALLHRSAPLQIPITFQSEK